MIGDLNSYSKEDLRALGMLIDQEVARRKTQDVAAAKELIADIAKSIGRPLSEILGFGVPQKRVKIPRRSWATEPRAVRHPEDVTLSWSGRGRRPLWLNNWVSSGRTVDELVAL